MTRTGKKSGADLRAGPLTDHRRIGALYLLLAASAAAVTILVGSAPLPELWLAPPSQAGWGGLQQSVPAVMGAFFIVMPVLAGFSSRFIPGMIGADGMAFPKLNALAFWLLTAAGVSFCAIAAGDGLGAEPAFLLAAFYLAGMSILFAAANLTATILGMRGEGVALHGMPLFVWSVLAASALALVAVPVCLAAGTMTVLDGAAAAWTGEESAFIAYPLLYVLILPAFGIVSQILSDAPHRLSGSYFAAAYAFVAMTFLSFVWWADFVLRRYPGAETGAYFVVAGVVVAAPVSLLCWHWMAALWKRRSRIEVPLLWAAGFVFLFIAGGAFAALLPGVSDNWAADRAAAHFYYVLPLSAAFAVFAGWYGWVGQIGGWRYPGWVGQVHFWFTFAGVNLVLLPLCMPGFTMAAALWRLCLPLGGCGDCRRSGSFRRWDGLEPPGGATGKAGNVWSFRSRAPPRCERFRRSSEKRTRANSSSTLM